MAGYGNRTAPDYVADDMTEQHEGTRLGLHDSHTAYSDAHPKYGSGATGGAGFGMLSHNIHSCKTNLLTPPQGNKSDLASAPTANDEFRFDLHKDTSPYSGANESRAGSGSTGGAGYGNKTGEFAHSGDSTMGKVMEKAGHMMKNEGLVAKGAAKRQEAMEEVKGKEEPPFAN
jgi:hypothetical protein